MSSPIDHGGAAADLEELKYEVRKLLMCFNEDEERIIPGYIIENLTRLSAESEGNHAKT